MKEEDELFESAVTVTTSEPAVIVTDGKYAWTFFDDYEYSSEDIMMTRLERRLFSSRLRYFADMLDGIDGVTQVDSLYRGDNC